MRAIVMIENAHKHLERAAARTSRASSKYLIAAASEVGPALFFSLLVITVSFLPVFTLEAQEGRLFSPLAFTKTFAMAAAAILSVTLVPVLMLLFVRGRIIPEHKNPINRLLIWAIPAGDPGCAQGQDADDRCWRSSCWRSASCPREQLGTEFMPTPERRHAAVHADHLARHFGDQGGGTCSKLRTSIIKTFPEVAAVFGKAGRAETATDPAPIEMFETIINLKPKEQWRAGHDGRRA